MTTGVVRAQYQRNDLARITISKVAAWTTESTITHILTSPADRLRVQFLWKMEGDVLGARLAMMPATHVLKHVPQRIGQNQALDDAVSCILYRPTKQDALIASRSYGTALSSLRTFLDDPILSQAPETLAAASLLQMYEQYADRPGQTWVLHARGVVRMLQVRSNLKDDLEKAILEAQACNVFMSALIANRECFLAHEAWNNMREPSTASECHLDVFMRIIVEGIRYPDLDSLLAPLFRQCEYDDSIPINHRVRIGTVAFADMLHMREHLNSHLDSSLGLECQLGTRDALRIAAYAATGFFVMTTNTILLGLIKQITLLAPESAPLLPDGLSEEVLKAERLSALEGVTARFQVLAILDPQIRVKAS
ncbi:hypothetical protein LTR91_013803 [Friedmanniomyces endolithicus]|uniref:Uncharacterized protein n=1 Tax=Friedmanniomyces endolithicus TaxID=329885 RepID=A0AAN6KD26_9PEZI|nr:hypothetical protein LTR75_010136 [Friedmanniomyces endolithicus]KAK0804268.1 hypothetical protein LTR59_004397 [Friedmanniomyces endolithicus]KAK0872501.1 hypothetical protein LTR87_012374 [Friedmanniomyces endolithicus]KAK0902123.1 hypothetical protein LTR02_008314 [Friedmanniomyces endolithicus]KAK0976098.1 hypothetical protein LTR91_013803 [Friedmanniomyces endolithicus]